MKERRRRADLLLVERGLAPTRAKAQALILAGKVHAGERRIEKAGEALDPDLALTVAAGPRWVGRAAGKLDAALDALGVDPRGRDALDVGASTGGFTQVLLERGASRVAAVDVGRGQLDWSLRGDPRVTVRDGVNARRLLPGDLPFPPSLATVDVSFISLRLVLPAIAGCLPETGEIVALVKPQFEVGRADVGAGGIVRDPSLHRAVLRGLVAFAAERGWGVAGVVPSAVPGAEGNREFFLRILPGARGLAPDAIDAAIESAAGDR